MDRPELEREVLKRLNIQRPCDIPVFKKAITLKPTPELEKILAGMKVAGKVNDN
ncbi:MAG: hypothetical protein PHG35_03390 [Dehalococcoidales bacterium]|nr:hypothetical protein [Dehalococcoidales bacterium]